MKLLLLPEDRRVIGVDPFQVHKNLVASRLAVIATFCVAVRDQSHKNLNLETLQAIQTNSNAPLSTPVVS